MDAIVLIGIRFTPSIENNQTDSFAFGKLGVVRKFPVNVAGATHNSGETEESFSKSLMEIRRDRSGYVRTVDVKK
jgi:hypothetical protein